jgi:hypothetical protein
MEGGQGALGVLIYLSLKYAPQEIIKGLQSGELGSTLFLRPVVHQAGLQPELVVVVTMWTPLGWEKVFRIPDILVWKRIIDL